MLFHSIPSEMVAQYSLPEVFTNPFDYQVHPLVRWAAEQVASWVEPLGEGKMFGVLIVEWGDEVGFVAAFSGMLEGNYMQAKFVPAIFDIELSKSYIASQQRLRDISARIQSVKRDAAYVALCEEFEQTNAEAEASLASLREEYATAKRLRSAQRVGADEATLKAINGESVAQKREIKATRAQWEGRLTSLKSEIKVFQQRVQALKRERATLSFSSQCAIFDEFKLHNAEGIQSSLLDIFERSRAQLPPSGAGECAAPKMLEYAYLNALIPRAMGEFWLGASPTAEPRYAGEFYTSCSGKCEPILGFMLEGLNVEQSELLQLSEPTVLFEDEHLILFDKPSGMLSVRGKVCAASLDDYMPDLHTVHRLDMDTSGVIIFAKSKEVKVALQRQFEERSAKKSYVALCQGEVTPLEGVVSLPLRCDIDNRPRQVVDYERGKQAVTHYRVIEYMGGVSRVEFTPITGRTHQLRMHAAHPEGLAAPIVGDRLYGRSAKRLCLHAHSLTLRHPITAQVMTITAPVPF